VFLGGGIGHGMDAPWKKNVLKKSARPSPLAGEGVTTKS
jgi:hypothetical protein